MWVSADRDSRTPASEMPAGTDAECIVVSNESALRQTNDGIRILPWRRFLEQLWSDAVVG